MTRLVAGLHKINKACFLQANFSHSLFVMQTENTLYRTSIKMPSYVVDDYSVDLLNDQHDQHSDELLLDLSKVSESNESGHFITIAE